jgi:hypothetical protein
MSPECKTNRGNLMQHWTLCEALTALQGATHETDPLLLYINAHAMKPLSRFREDQDEKFRRVRENLPGRGGVYEKTWRDLVPGNVKQYPSSAAFVDRIWDGQRAYLLCEQSKERAQECNGWLAKLKLAGRVFSYQVFDGDWQDRFNRAGEVPLARLKQDKADVMKTWPCADFSFIRDLLRILFWCKPVFAGIEPILPTFLGTSPRRP